MEKITHKTEDETLALRLAHLYQQWAEICRSGIQREVAPALKWFMTGMSIAHELDASRAREAASQTVTSGPPAGGFEFSRAYEMLVKMVTTLGDASPQTVAGPESQGIDVSSEPLFQVLPDLQRRVKKLNNEES